MTKQQEIAVRGQVDAKLSAIFSDTIDRAFVVNTIVDMIIEDINETADWSNIDSDEVIIDDINISIARVLKAIITIGY